MTTSTGKRPGGRSARVKGAVYRAVFDLLQDEDWESLSIGKVAERSGVHQATIYRRWKTVGALISEVVNAELSRTSPLPDTGTLRGDLETYVSRVATMIADPSSRILLRASLVGSRGESGEPATDYLAERGAALQSMFDRATERGEKAPTLEQFLSTVLAPIYFYSMFGEPVGQDHAMLLVDRLLTVVDQGALRHRLARGKAWPRERVAVHSVGTADGRVGRERRGRRGAETG